MIHRPHPRLRGYQATPEGILMPDRGGNVCSLGMGHGSGHGLAKVSGGGWTPDEWTDKYVDHWAENTDVAVGGDPTVMYSTLNATLYNPSARVTKLEIDAAMNNRPVINFNPTSEASGITFRFRPPAPQPAGTVKIFWVGNMRSTAQYQALFGNDPTYKYNIPYMTGRGIANRRGWVWGSGIEKWFVDSTTGPISRIFEFSGTTGRIWGPSGLIGTDACYTVVFSATSYSNWGCRNVSGVAFEPLKNCGFARGIIRIGADLNLEDRTNWFGWCDSYYGVVN